MLLKVLVFSLMQSHLHASQATHHVTFHILLKNCLSYQEAEWTMMELQHGREGWQTDKLQDFKRTINI